MTATEIRDWSEARCFAWRIWQATIHQPLGRRDAIHDIMANVKNGDGSRKSEAEATAYLDWIERGHFKLHTERHADYMARAKAKAATTSDRFVWPKHICPQLTDVTRAPILTAIGGVAIL